MSKVKQFCTASTSQDEKTTFLSQMNRQKITHNDLPPALSSKNQRRPALRASKKKNDFRRRVPYRTGASEQFHPPRSKQTLPIKVPVPEIAADLHHKHERVEHGLRERHRGLLQEPAVSGARIDGRMARHRPLGESDLVLRAGRQLHVACRTEELSEEGRHRPHVLHAQHAPWPGFDVGEPEGPLLQGLVEGVRVRRGRHRAPHRHRLRLLCYVFGP